VTSSDRARTGVAVGSSRICIKVPLTHRDPNRLFRSQWQGFNSRHHSHVRPEWLRLPRRARAGYYRGWAEISTLDDILVTEQYSDALEGISRAPTDLGSSEDGNVVVHVMRCGEMILKQDRRVSVTPGTLCIRDALLPWEFSYSAGSRMQVVLIPRRALVGVGGLREIPALTVVPQSLPEARLLTAHLKLAQENLAGMTAAGVHASRQAAAELVAGVLVGRAASTDPAFASSLHLAARRLVESQLPTGDLSPALVAKGVGVSVRTLHRAFAGSGESLTSYARRRRLERARDDLLFLDGGRRTVTEIAARWHFADASHFSRSFKSHFGLLPSAAKSGEASR